MLLRAASGMGVVILLQAFVTQAWQQLLLCALMGLTFGYIPNAMALVAAQVPCDRSGWALSCVSTG
nr:drug efflux system protein MdtG [Candidatus Pantoea persica]